MSINHLYHTWFNQVQQLRPGERVTRLRNLAWLLVGICSSKSVHLSKVALKIPGAANSLSITRRLSRFLDNPAIRVREWYAPIARNVLGAMADTVGEIRLIADGTKVGCCRCTDANCQVARYAIVFLTFRRCGTTISSDTR